MDGLRRKSDENWQASEKCFVNGLFNAAASRLYYSVFQAVRYSDAMKALPAPIPKDSSPKHHAAELAVGSCGQDVRSAKRHFSELLILRETADYDPEPVEAEELQPHFDRAQRIRSFFIGRVTS
ncbi:MAG: HEPN domain-containing protein [Verrucomicrobiota bacterium]